MDQLVRRLLFLGMALTGLLSYSTSAQRPLVGKYLYEKLAKTQQEYKEAIATGDSMEVAEKCYLLGKRHSAVGDYVTAQAWFIRSLRIREPLGPSENIGKVHLRMAENHIVQRQHGQAMTHARQAMTNFSHVRSQHGEMGAFIVLAGVHDLGWRMNREKAGSIPEASLDSALFFFRKAERLAIALKKAPDIANVYLCMGKTLALRNGNLALPYLKKAYAINLEQKTPYSIINSLQELASCYLAIDQPLTAKKWLDQAAYVRDTARHGDYWQNGLLEEIYTKLYQQTGQWKLAFEHQQKHNQLRMEALNADREGAIAQAEMRYESEKKGVQLNAQKRMTWMTTVLFGITAIGCLVFYWLFRKYRRLSEHNAKLVKEQNHRVKNNLQSITSLLGLQYNRLTDPAAREAVEESLLRVEAMALVHQRLYDGERLVEVDLREYIPELVSGVLRSFNFDHVQPKYTLSPIWLDADRAISVGLLLNELVTNSCKYAFPDHPKPALEISCQEVNGKLNVLFVDNGPGFTPKPKANSFGMKLMDMITQKLKGKSYFNMDNGCSFTLSFDLSTLVTLQ